MNRHNTRLEIGLQHYSLNIHTFSKTAKIEFPQHVPLLPPLSFAEGQKKI
uniref:Uncharacterized protein n=1 Tax=Anguilla anguilla TaxID=7936 RepID=A0A0E9UIK2_ANGAN